MFEPLQTTWSAGSFTCPDGLTVMVNVLDGPVQEPPSLIKVGITTMEATMGDNPLLMAINGGMSPEPLAESPIPGVLFVQEYVVIPTVLDVPKVICEVDVPLQTN